MTKKKTAAAPAAPSPAPAEAPAPPKNQRYLVRLRDGAIMGYSKALASKPGFQEYEGDPSQYVHRPVRNSDDMNTGKPMTLDVLQVHAAALGYKLVPISASPDAPRAVESIVKSQYQTQGTIQMPEKTLDTDAPAKAPVKGAVAPPDTEIPEHVAAEIAELRSQSEQDLRDFAAGFGVDFEPKTKRVTILNRCIELLKDNLVEA